MQGQKHKALIYVGVFAVYVLLTLLMSYPVVARLSTHLIGDGDDMWVHYWNNWWVERALEGENELYHTNLLFHPTGVSLLHQNFAWVNIALWLGLKPLVGGIAAYNLVHLLHIPLCGLSMFLLVRHLTKSDASAFVGGLIFAFLPFRMLDTNHPNMVSTEGFPLLMLFLLRLFEDDSPIRDGLIAGILIALIGYMRWQLLILAAFMIVSYLVYVLFWEHRRWSRRTVAALGLVAIVAGVLMAPGLYPYVREVAQEGVAGELYVLTPEPGKQDLLSYLVPQRQHLLSPLYDEVFVRWSKAAARHTYSAFLGHVVVALAVVAVLRRGRQGGIRFWLGLAVTSFVLGLGPYLRFNRILRENIPLPYQLVGWLPPLRMLGVSLRFNALLGVPLAVLAAYGAQDLRHWLTKRQWGARLARPGIFVLVLGLLILVDYRSIPTSTVSAQVPDFYYELAEEPGDFAIVGLPGKRHHTERYMFYQTVHRRPILGGHVSRLPAEALDFASSVPLIADMYTEVAIDTSLPDISRQLSLLAEADFKYVIIHKDLATEQQLRAWQVYLAIPPRYEDSKVAVYPTQPVVGLDCPVEHDLGKGIALVETSLSSRDVNPDAILEMSVIWGTTASPGENLRLELALVDEEGNVGQTEQFEISPSWPIQEWPANAIVRDDYSFQVEPWPGAGRHTVVASLARAEDGRPVGQPAEVGEVVVHMPDRVFAAPPTERHAQARFGDALRLLGYDLDIDASAANVTLHWKALRRMERSYKFFVHLYEVDDHEIVAQKDVIPYDWGYPTVWWEAEEIVSDEVEVPLDQVPPEVYLLAVGVYDPDAAERLPIFGEQVEVFSRALILQKVSVP
ncbi:MAG: glycosyltransferase family 39 protein [Anaerolineae bacterium]